MKISPISMPKTMPTIKNNNPPSFGYRLGMIGEAQVCYGVSDDFRNQVGQTISKYPTKYVRRTNSDVWKPYGCACRFNRC